MTLLIFFTKMARPPEESRGHDTITDDLNFVNFSTLVPLLGYEAGFLTARCERIIRQYELRESKIRRVYRQTNDATAIDGVLRQIPMLTYDSPLTRQLATLFPGLNFDVADRVFLNVHYRHLLRAALERRLLAVNPLPNIFFRNPDKYIDNRTMQNLLQLIQVICHTLGLTSLLDTRPLELSNFENANFWVNISQRLDSTIGRTHCMDPGLLEVIDRHDPRVAELFRLTTIAGATQTFKDLVTLWNGSDVTITDEHVQIVPLPCVLRHVEMIECTVPM